MVHTLTTIPVGSCFKITHDEVLFTFWPPFPDPFTNCSLISASDTSGRFGGAVLERAPHTLRPNGARLTARHMESFFVFFLLCSLLGTMDKKNCARNEETKKKKKKPRFENDTSFGVQFVRSFWFAWPIKSPKKTKAKTFLSSLCGLSKFETCVCDCE
jgi:hypothetical protein